MDENVDGDPRIWFHAQNVEHHFNITDLVVKNIIQDYEKSDYSVYDFVYKYRTTPKLV